MDSLANISIHAPRTGSDILIPNLCTKPIYFNPRSPHGERPATEAKLQPWLDISIHAPRTGSDERRIDGFNCRDAFQSTLPARGATGGHRDGAAARPHFNPRSPHGERRFIPMTTERLSSFQSTLPARGATKHHLERLNPQKISIHAPRTGSDRNRTVIFFARRLFQSTLPARGATASSI